MSSHCSMDWDSIIWITFQTPQNGLSYSLQWPNSQLLNPFNHSCWIITSPMLRKYVTLSKWFCTADSCIHKSGFINSVSEGSKIWVLNWQLLSEGEVSNTYYFGQRKSLARGSCSSLIHQSFYLPLTDVSRTKFNKSNKIWWSKSVLKLSYQ